MKSNTDLVRRPNGGIVKRRMRGFITRDQRLPESPPMCDERTVTQSIWHACRAKCRDAFEALFGCPQRVLNIECLAFMQHGLNPNSRAFGSPYVVSHSPSSSAPVLAAHPFSVPHRSLNGGLSRTASGASVGSDTHEGACLSADQVVPSLQYAQPTDSGVLSVNSAESCECGNDIWRPGGFSTEDMLKSAKELSRRIMTLYAKVVDPETGTVDYKTLLHCEDFKNYLQASRKLRYFNPLLLNEEERKAFFLNIYNCLMIHAIAVLTRPKNPFGRTQLFNKAAYCIGGRIYSLNMIEHGVLRANRPGVGPLAQTPFMEGDARIQCTLSSLDPRIHFALNCGARSCPAVRFYDPSSVDKALDMACRSFLNDLDIDVEHRTVTLSKIFQWYRLDFTENGDDEVLLKWILPYLPTEKQAILVRLMEDLKLEGIPIKITYADYDWSVNDSSL